LKNLYYWGKSAKEFAAKEKLEIVASFCEAKTAKEPRSIPTSSGTTGQAGKISPPLRLQSNLIQGRLEPHFTKPPIDFFSQNSLQFGCRARRRG